MEIKTVTETISKETTVYIAFDGKEFNYKGDCLRYEEKEAIKRLKESKNLKYYPEAENCEFPYYNDIPGAAEFYYFKILNEEGLEEIINHVCILSPEYYDRGLFSNEKIGDIVCIFMDDHNDGVQFSNMKYQKKDIESFFNKFNWEK